MGTVNGKLITQELNQFDELTHRTERINQRFEYLESQVTAMSKQNYAQDFQNLSQEVNSNKSYLQKLDQRIGFLEDLISRQAKQLFFLKIGSAIVLIGLGFIFSMNNHPEVRSQNSGVRSHNSKVRIQASESLSLADILHLGY